jgi:hypothetical protein
MPIATITSVNLPTHQYPHVEVNINDNTLRRYTSTGTEYGKTLCVFRSPKGPDGIHKVTGLDQFNDLYGNGSVEQYGQPLLNARTMAASNNVTMYCLRATADDAVVANLHIFARYRVKEYYIAENDIHGPTWDGTSADRDIIYKQGSIVPGEIDVCFVAKTDDTLHNVADLCKDEKYANNLVSKIVYPSDDTTQKYHTETVKDYNVIPPVSPTTEGSFGDWQEVRLMSIAALGKGNYGNALSFSIASDPNRDKSNDFKNYWFQIYEGSSLIEKFAITVSSNAIVRNVSKYISNVVNDDDYDGNASSVLRVDFNEDAVKLLYNEFNQRVNPGYISYNAFDPLLGLDKRKVASRAITTDKTMTGYVICDTAIESDTWQDYAYPARKYGDPATAADYAAAIAYGGGFYPATMVEEPDIQEYPNTDDATYYNFSAITGTSLESGNEGKFAITTKNGTALNETEVTNAVNAVYTKIFQGETRVRSAYYNYINTVIFNGETEYRNVDTNAVIESRSTLPEATSQQANKLYVFTGSTTYEYEKVYKCVETVVEETTTYSWVKQTDITVTKVTKSRRVKNIQLYFDENNNFLLDLLTPDADNPSAPIENIDANSADRYVIVSKHGSIIEVPARANRVSSVPDTITTDYPYPDMLSKNKTEIDFFLDAGYSYETKMAICNWVNNHRSEEFVVYLDAGTSETLVAKVDAYTWVQAFDEATNGSDAKKYWYFSIDAYYGKIKDPYNYKIVEVTSTYNLARHLVQHWRENGGKHIPYAGSLYAVIDSYLPMSVFPLMDEGLDSEHMDRFIEEHVNYAQVNSRGDVIRATQSTRYPVLGDAFTLSNLTEINNVHIVLDIKKDAEHVCELFSYQFNETSDLKRFNSILANSILPKYSAAQVKSISANFTRTSEEAEYGILHLYIQVVHKNLVKIVMVDIDVNRNTD